MSLLIQTRYRLKKSPLAKSLILGVNDRLPLEVKDRLYRHLVDPYSEHEENNDVVFVHVPKTAGNSIFQALFGVPAHGHDPAERYRRFDAERFARYYKFGFVRHPLDRLVSAYVYLEKGGIGRYDRAFRDKYLRGVSGFDDFLRRLASRSRYRRRVMRWVHFRPQAEFLCDAEGQPLVDYVGRYENIDADYRRIAADLRISRVAPLEVVNATARRDYRDYYDSELTAIASRLYRRDFEIFGYTP
ncbi:MULTISPECIES: sulfotransferase family 2 domain-containing protein [unclassified Salinicola]|uniref:sulfotransferase family 2 domain-containing protein n=1 Tax=unclassified Salinicola TaxID=2634022 RepID=UPI001A90951E|nr:MULTISPECIES: sulfotransferase family 2 domain-containing protein [unclassified Salinicola]MCE3025567.1 sulfotransferase family protein [Salinicola sp. DM10]WIX34574.1 sulfotransferase family 2 domain-containing protein [Salinicola sp. JS01]